MRQILIWVGSALAVCFYIVGARKRVTLENIARAFPEMTELERNRLARSAYKSLGCVFAEMVYLRFASLKAINTNTIIANPELYHATLNQGKGLIVVAGHYANWEWLALGGAIGLGSNFSIVRKNIPSKGIEKFLERLRIRSGNTLINSGDVRSMVMTLRAGKCLAILADQAAPSESVAINFFSIPTHTFEGPAWLALRTGANMLFAECNLDGSGKYVIRFHPIPIYPADTVLTLTQRHASILESIIRRRPELWLWQHKRWKYSS
ncbi:MAG TPA: lysophospholipid acyltransferase family protein [Candidatus Kapabacteria bacterium]|nr:lysophospholipid acyltransferase family protein [Candidatus Kapabacteria bacterium]